MNVGDVVTMNSAKVQFENDIASGTLTYKAEKSKRLVFMFMGAEDISEEGKKIDGAKLLDELGWEPKKP